MSRGGSRATRTITFELDPWAYEQLAREASERELSIEQLASFAVAYYLADSDSARVARRGVPPGLGEQPPS